MFDFQLCDTFFIRWEEGLEFLLVHLDAPVDEMRPKFGYWHTVLNRSI